MKNNRILFILVYSCIFLLFCFENPAYSKDKVDLTIYSNGKKFGSLHDYKLTMLKQKILDSIPLGKEDQFEGFLNNFSNILSNETSKEYSESDLKLLFQEIYKSFVNNEIERPKGGDLDSMQKMLEDYNQDNDRSGTYVIDPEKVKTLIIEPSTNQKGRK